MSNCPACGKSATNVLCPFCGDELIHDDELHEYYCEKHGTRWWLTPTNIEGWKADSGSIVRKSDDADKRSRIFVNKRTGKVIASRVFGYTTSFGENSAGYEETYDDFATAVEEENKWLKERTD